MVKYDANNAEPFRSILKAIPSVMNASIAKNAIKPIVEVKQLQFVFSIS